MLLLRTLPDLASASVEFRARFHSKWGRENCIIWGRARQVKFGPCPHALSIRAAWGGEERCRFNGRTVAVDDDSFLILNNGRICETQIDSVQPVESISIHFRAGLVERAYGAMTLAIEDALDRGDLVVERSAEFDESLQPHDKLVSPVVRFIKVHLLQGVDDEAWYDEQLHFLLARMLAHRDALVRRIDSLRLARATTRHEIYRRISIATDFLHSNYGEGLDLAVLGQTACLSKYHFLRLFTLVHGVTPHQYLQRKRAQVALRLLRTTSFPLQEIAVRVGFAHRHSLVRQLRQWTGLTLREIRRRRAPELALARRLEGSNRFQNAT
jgi:AraC family transcriptional regulator